MFTFRKYVAWYMVIAMFLIGIAPRVEASYVPSQTMGPGSMEREADLKKVQALLETKMVKQRLEDLGFSGAEIAARLSRLSSQQIHAIAMNLDDLKVGKDSGLSVVIGLLVIAILVVILLKIADRRIIITK